MKREYLKPFLRSLEAEPFRLRWFRESILPDAAIARVVLRDLLAKPPDYHFPPMQDPDTTRTNSEAMREWSKREDEGRRAAVGGFRQAAHYRADTRVRRTVTRLPDPEEP